MSSEPKSAYTVSKLVELWNQGVQHGVDIERASVVAWLRREASAMHPAEPDRPILSHSERSLLLVFAACIERGDHLPKEDT